MLQIGPNFSSFERKMIVYGMARIMRYSQCIEFKVLQGRPRGIDYIMFSNERKMCSSAIGRVGGRQKIYVGHDSCFDNDGTVIHELMHALGFIHEHQRRDRRGGTIWHKAKTVFQGRLPPHPA